MDDVTRNIALVSSGGDVVGEAWDGGGGGGRGGEVRLGGGDVTREGPR